MVDCVVVVIILEINGKNWPVYNPV